MDTEEKKYIVNIESNVDDYVKQLQAADKAVEDFIQANADLLASQDKSNKDYLKAAATLKVLQTERANASKNVQTAIKANKAEADSYEKLYRNWQLAQTQLKLMGDAYEVNEKGVRVLSQRFIEQSKVVDNAKKALDAFGKEIHDNRINVGNYSEAIQGAVGNLQMIPGPIGAAVGGLKNMTLAAKAFIATPIGAILAAVVAVIGLLTKAFKNSQPLMDMFDKTSAAISATFKVLLDRVSNFAEFLGSIFSKKLRESRKAARELNDELIGIEDTMDRREKRELRRANRKGLIEEIREEAKAAGELSDAERAVDDAEIGFIQRKAELRRSIEELINSSKDENLTNKEKLANLNEAIKLQGELTAKEVGFAKERARISQEQVDQGNSTREELRANEELQAAATEAEAQGLKETKRILSERFTLINKLTAEEQKSISEIEAAKKKASEDEIARLKKEADEAAARLKAEIDAEREYIIAQQQAEDEYNEFFAEKKKAAELINAENRLAIREQENEWKFNLEREALDRQMKQELEAAEKVGADRQLIAEKYAAARKTLDEMEVKSKLGLYGDFAGNIAQIFGENTAIGKAAAVAQAIINTYQSATAAYASLAAVPVVGPALGIAAAGAAVAAGIANVKKIVAVKSGLPGDSGGGSATSLSASVPAQRMTATANKPTVLTQMSQQQLNAQANTPQLTKEDLVDAFSSMPAPRVTVEDINAKQKEVQKVQVGATI